MGAVAGMGGGAAPSSSAPSGERAYWRPRPGTSWQWQLSGSLDTSFGVAAYDIDLFDTSAATVASLHAAGRKVICYFDTAYEPGRPDSSTLAAYRGKAVDGWPGQYWLDTREQAVRDVMLARVQLAGSKGCDATEADDIDVRSNDSGFAISADDQRSFIISLAEAAHAAGMAFGLKNDLEDVAALVAYADFAINEECFRYHECDALRPFVSAGKAVFQVEYAQGSFDAAAETICPQANALDFDTLIKHREVGAERRACR